MIGRYRDYTKILGYREPHGPGPLLRSFAFCVFNYDVAPPLIDGALTIGQLASSGFQAFRRGSVCI